MEDDAFLPRLPDLLGVRRHLLHGLQRHDVHLASAEADGRAGDVQGGDDVDLGVDDLRRRHGPQRGPGDVDGHVAAPDHDHPLTQVQPVAQVRVEQEVDAVDHSVQVFPRQVELSTLVRADGQERGTEALAAKIAEREVATQPLMDPQLDAQAENRADFQIDQLPREPVLGDAETQHAPRHGLGFEDRDGVSVQRQVVRRGEAGRAGPDHRHAIVGMPDAALAVDLPEHVQVDHALDAESFRGEALEGANRHRLVDFLSAADPLARRGANATAYRGQGIRTASHRVGVPVPPLRDQRYVAASLGSHRAGGMTGEVGL
jgi:hypothetical protein